VKKYKSRKSSNGEENIDKENGAIEFKDFGC